MTDVEGRYTYQNPASIRRWGTPDRPAPGPVHRSARGTSVRAGSTRIGARSPASWSARRRSSGRESEEQFIASVIAPIRDGTGVVGVLGASWDVGELRRAEAALRRSEERFRAAADAGLDSFFLLEAIRDPAGAITDFRIVDCNQRFVDMLRLTREQIVGQPLGEAAALRPRDRPAPELRAGPEPPASRRRASTPSTSRPWAAAGSSTRWCRSARRRGRDLARRDRTPPGGAGANHPRGPPPAGREAREPRRAWPAGVAHDFNNLLVGILGNAALLREELAADSPLRPLAEQLQAAAMQAADLTRQMLNFTGKGAMELQRVDLSDLAGEVAHLLRSTVSRRIEFKLELPAGLPLVEGDPAQLRQIVMNLVLNGAEAIGEGSGVVTLRTRSRLADRVLLDATDVHDDLPEGVYVVLEVEDSGHGMDVATRERIFEPFFTTKFTGRGLGLAGRHGHGAFAPRRDQGRERTGAVHPVLDPAPGGACRSGCGAATCGACPEGLRRPRHRATRHRAGGRRRACGPQRGRPDAQACRPRRPRRWQRGGSTRAGPGARRPGSTWCCSTSSCPASPGRRRWSSSRSWCRGSGSSPPADMPRVRRPRCFGQGRDVQFLQKPYRPDELMKVVTAALGD